MAPMTTGLKRLSSTVSTFSLRALANALSVASIAAMWPVMSRCTSGSMSAKCRIGRDTLEPPHYPFHIDKLLFGAQLVEMFHLIAQDAEIPLELLLLCEGDQLPTTLDPLAPATLLDDMRELMRQQPPPRRRARECRPAEDHVPADRAGFGAHVQRRLRRPCVHVHEPG